jgi:hypothetical protein
MCEPILLVVHLQNIWHLPLFLPVLGVPPLFRCHGWELHCVLQLSILLVPLLGAALRVAENILLVPLLGAALHVAIFIGSSPAYCLHAPMSI